MVIRSSEGCCALLTALLLVSPTPAENWPGWRGPGGNGVSTEKRLPLAWSKTQNVRWAALVPGAGFSSPIVWHDRIFLTAAFDKGARRAVHCLDRAGGRILWTREIADPDPELASAMTGHAAPTPATDGAHVVAFFGNAGMVCYDFAGKQLWRRKLGSFNSELGLASSPLLAHGRVFQVCDHDGDRFTSFDSFLIALDVRTGAVLWKTERPGVYRSWSTPLLLGATYGRDLIVCASEQVRGYVAATGEEHWRLQGLTGWVAPSPVFADGKVFAASGKNGPVLAIRPGGKGDVTDRAVLWKQRAGGPYVCSPLAVGDFLYVHNEDGILCCYAAATGKLQYRERLEGKFYASAVAGAGRLYLTNDGGRTYVIALGSHFQLLERNDLGEYCLASPALSGGEIFIRTEHHLYCIGSSRTR